MVTFVVVVAFVVVVVTFVVVVGAFGVVVVIFVVGVVAFGVVVSGGVALVELTFVTLGIILEGVVDSSINLDFVHTLNYLRQWWKWDIVDGKILMPLQYDRWSKTWSICRIQ